MASKPGSFSFGGKKCSIRAVGGYTNKEEAWDFRTVVDSAAGPGKCTRRPARTAKRNARSLLNPAKTVPSIARNVSPSTRTAAGKKGVLPQFGPGSVMS